MSTMQLDHENSVQGSCTRLQEYHLTCSDECCAEHYNALWVLQHYVGPPNRSCYTCAYWLSWWGGLSSTTKYYYHITQIIEEERGM